MYYCLSGYKNEGWFDPWTLLSGFKQKALSIGVNYIPGEATDINVEGECVKSVKVRIYIGTEFPGFGVHIIVYLSSSGLNTLLGFSFGCLNVCVCVYVL